jgi:anaerobic selenocysteine-containing dehydrogenase
MTAIGDALLDRDPPVTRSTSTTRTRCGRAGSGKCARGFAREDLFCVVHEIFPTDTADFADILLPATTQLEQSTSTIPTASLRAGEQPAIAPLGEALPNTEVFAGSRADGLHRDLLPDRRGHGASRVERRRSAARDLDWDVLKRDGWQRLERPEAYAPFAKAISRRRRASANS